MEYSKIILIANASIWLFTFYHNYQRRKVFDTGAWLIAFLSALSILSYFLYNDSIYGLMFQPITILPCLYYYGVFLAYLVPFRRINAKHQLVINDPDMVIFNLFAAIIILVALFRVPGMLRDLPQILYSIVFETEIGAELYNDSRDLVAKTGHGIRNLPSVLSSAFYGLGILMSFYYLTLPKKKRNGFILFGLFLAGLIQGIGTISYGQRGGVIAYMLLIIPTYFLFKDNISNGIKKYTKWIGITLIIIMMIPIIAITMSRFDTKESNPLSSFYYYAGQSNLYFNNFAFDDNGIRYGDRTIPLFKRAFGFNNVPHNYVERREKYPNLYINDEVFSTTVGDFAIDFGPLSALIILLIIALIISQGTIIRGGSIYFHQLILLHITIQFFSIGALKLDPLADTGGNLQIIIYVIAYYMFKLSQKH